MASPASAKPSYFSKALAYVFGDEGGYAPKTSIGNETYRGIDRGYWKLWPGWKIVDAAKIQPNFPKSLDANTSLQQLVAAFYKINFWKEAYDEIVSQAIAIKLFDEAVNMDSTKAVECLQQAVCSMGLQITVDGQIGNATLKAVNTIHPDELMAAYIKELKEWYVKDAAENPSKRPDLEGWLNRANRIPPNN